MSSNSSNEVKIVVGILAGVLVVFVVGAIGLVGAGYFLVGMSSRSTMTYPMTTPLPVPVSVESEAVESSNGLSESRADEPVAAPVPEATGMDHATADDAVIAPIPAASTVP